MNLAAMFSMWQLTVKDKAEIAYLGLMMLWYFIFRPLEALTLQGFKMIAENNTGGLLIYNDNYKLNIVDT
jgi:hypothetical protein